MEKEFEKLEKDLIGNRFYRCYYKIIVEQYGYAAAKNEAEKLYDDLKRILYFNLKRVEAMSKMIGNNEIEKITTQYSEKIRTFLSLDIGFTQDLYSHCKKSSIHP